VTLGVKTLRRISEGNIGCWFCARRQQEGREFEGGDRCSCNTVVTIPVTHTRHRVLENKDQSIASHK